jgi:hypothetical protein
MDAIGLRERASDFSSSSKSYKIRQSKMLKPYLKKIYEIASRGDAREESYYSTLEELLGGYAQSIGKKNIHVTTLPKRTESGNPILESGMEINISPAI